MLPQALAKPNMRRRVTRISERYFELYHKAYRTAVLARACDRRRAPKDGMMQPRSARPDRASMQGCAAFDPAPPKPKTL